MEGLIPFCLYDAVNSKQGSCTLDMQTTSIVPKSAAAFSFFRDSKCVSSIALSLYLPDALDTSYDNVQETLRSCLTLRRLFLFNYEGHPATCSMLPGRMRIPVRPLDELLIGGYGLEPASKELWGNECICEYCELIPGSWSEVGKLTDTNGEKRGRKASTATSRPLRQRSILEFFVLTGLDGKALEDSVRNLRNRTLGQCDIMEIFKPLARNENMTRSMDGAPCTANSFC